MFSMTFSYSSERSRKNDSGLEKFRPAFQKMIIPQGVVALIKKDERMI